MDCTLTVVDTTGIQDYIFGTNNLQQNVGASERVKSVTGSWLVEALPAAHNVANAVGVVTRNVTLAYDDTRRIEAGAVDAEVIYAGGGNALLLFARRVEAVAFTRRLTARVLREAPGLRVVVLHCDFDWQTSPLGSRQGQLEAALRQIVQRKAARVGDNRQLGLGVTAAGVFTDKPATGRDDNRYLSEEARAKQKVGRSVAEPLALRGSFVTPKDFDDFGQQKGKSSYIAIVHADGNHMGKRFQALRDRHMEAGPGNRAYVQALRNLSLSIFNASQQALQNTVDALADTLQPDGDFFRIGPYEFPLKENKLPYRTLVLGGDDVTFVCEGRLGLTMAVRYLEEVAKVALDDGQTEAPMYSRAGVVIVKSHYPFARAYDLAVALLRSAKKKLKDSREEKSAVDWHFVQSGISGSLEEIRDREYRVDAERSLHRRPLIVQATRPGGVDAWQNFAEVVQAFNGAPDWISRRNKVMALREVLRQGTDAVKAYRVANRLPELPSIPDLPDMQVGGWQGNICGYFDAIEAMEFFVPLDTDQTGGG